MNSNTVIYKFVTRFNADELAKNPSRSGRNPIVGVVLASKRDDGTVGIGWSRCAINRGDDFNETTGLKMALGRAEKGTINMPPFTMIPEIKIIQKRARNYFKDSLVCNVV